MTIAESTLAQPSITLDLDSQMIFASQGQYLVTCGEFERFEICVDDYCAGSGRLSQLLQSKLQMAKNAGVAQPIVVGICPFDNSQTSQLLIPTRWQYCSTEQLQQKLLSASWLQPGIKSMQQIPNAQGYKELVARGKDKLQQDKLHHLVLSQCQDIITRSRISKTTILEQLIRNNHQGYHFSVPVQQGRVMMGVSPELLLRKQQLNIESHLLAGSRKRDKDPAVNKHRQQELLSTDKDRAEHSYALGSIKQTLNPFCSALMAADEPSILGTSHTWHLSSHIDGRLAEDKLCALELACLLNPSSSALGNAAVEAKDAVTELEPFEREYFTGAVGWMDMQGNGEWVVSTHCAMLAQQQARLYAAAGIVETSVPEEKLCEINAKYKTMQQALGFSNWQSASLDPGQALTS